MQYDHTQTAPIYLILVGVGIGMLVAAWLIRIVGKLDFSLVGVIATITKTLADVSISVFVMSTYDTDYFLVRQIDLDRTVEALEKVEHRILRSARR